MHFQRVFKGFASLRSMSQRSHAAATRGADLLARAARGATLVEEVIEVVISRRLAHVRFGVKRT
jgi:hypothetical protein